MHPRTRLAIARRSILYASGRFILLPHDIGSKGRKAELVPLQRRRSWWAHRPIFWMLYESFLGRVTAQNDPYSDRVRRGAQNYRGLICSQFLAVELALISQLSAPLPPSTALVPPIANS
jgi:hypothetical protein